MLKIRSLFRLSSEAQKARVVTLGIFDGVHRGHQAILKKLKELDPSNGLVITFTEHPDEVLWNRKVRWICTHRHRIELLRRYGASHVVTLPFTKELSEVSAKDFAETLFCEVLPKPQVIVGYDLRFGHQARGDFNFLQKNFSNDFQATQIDPVACEDRPVSSTRVREAVLMGELSRVKEMLGRDFTTCGEVVKGYQRGRQLGFPTANLNVEPYMVLPPFGVYAVRVRGLEQEKRAIANLGVRPTFENDQNPQLEVHIPDFSSDLYGKELEIVWDFFIRPEKRFSNKEELIQQIQKDIKKALSVT